MSRRRTARTSTSPWGNMEGAGTVSHRWQQSRRRRVLATWLRCVAEEYNCWRSCVLFDQRYTAAKPSTSIRPRSGMAQISANRISGRTPLLNLLRSDFVFFFRSVSCKLPPFTITVVNRHTACQPHCHPRGRDFSIAIVSAPSREQNAQQPEAALGRPHHHRHHH